MNFKNLPWWGFMVIGALVGGLVIWSGYKMSPVELSAKIEKVDGLEEDLERKQAEIRKAKQAVAKLDELEREISDLEMKLADLRQILPTAPEMGDMLKWIKSLADQTNLDLIVFNPQGTQAKEFLVEHPVDMEVFGNYHQLGMFFDRVSKYARVINVENVRVGQNRTKGVRASINAKFVAKTYVYGADEEAATAGGDA